MANTGPTRKKRRFSRRALIWAGVIIVLLGVCVGGGAWLQSSMAASAQQAALAQWKVETAQSGTIEASVSATGNIEPKAQANLNFAITGTVTEILVKPGDRVTKGQPLARIDTTDLELQLEQAEATLKQAQADRVDLMDGATPQEIANAELRLQQARAQYQQTAGSVTQADIAAARARLEAAQANLAALEAGNTDEKAAELSLQQALTQLQAQRDQLSAAKTSAQLRMEQNANSLAQAQTSYSTAKQNWEYVQETGRDPLSRVTDPATGKSSNTKVSEQQRQQYYEAFVQAQTAMQNAEKALQQAQIDYENARQAEITGVQVAEQNVISAQMRLDSLRAGGLNQQIASARAEVAAAQAALDQLIGAQRAGSLNVAQAAIDIAQQELENLSAEPSASALARADAAVANAEVGVRQAKLALERATLTAPFDGTIAQIGINVGESSAAGSGTTSSAIVLADISSFHIDVPIDELDIALVEAGQKVIVTLDALPDVQLNGTVTNVEPIATQSSTGTNTYNVTIDIEPTEATLRSGMTASVQIITQRRENVVLVPRRAIQTEGTEIFVLIPTDGPPDLQAMRPASERRAVTLGLSNGEQIEITSGLQAGEQVLVQDVVQTFNPFN